jgi:hypothetical protein
VAAGPVDLLARYVRTGLFDVVLTHNRHTLVDDSASGLIDLAAQREMGIVNAAAALQFSTRAPRVHSTVVSFSSPERVRAAITLATAPIPPQVMRGLRAAQPCHGGVGVARRNKPFGGQLLDPGGLGGQELPPGRRRLPRRWPQPGGSQDRLAKAASMARSAQSGLGRATCRRSTATSCRSTRISASLAESLRARSTSQPNTRTMDMNM